MIPVTRTFLPPLDEYEELIRRVWDSRWLTNRGVLVRELEERLTAHLGVPDLLAVSNGTIALQIAIKALQLQGEVITTPFSYVATASSIVWEGCVPVFADIDPEHLTIDESRIEDVITEKTSAILATHVYGNPCNVEAIQDIADRHGLKVIYDAAHCFGVRFKGASLMNWGDASILSFHATKLFHTGEGGAIICPDRAVFDTVYYHHNFGHRGEEEFWGVGINGKMSELNAAMGLAVLPYLDAITEGRRRVCQIYDALLDTAELRRLRLREQTEWNYSYYPVIFPSEDCLLKVKTRLNDQDIYPRRYFYPSLNTLPYLSRSSMPVAEDLSRRVLCLPLYADLTDDDVSRICELIRKAV